MISTTHLTYLGELSRVTKGVWQPKLFTHTTKFPLEEQLSVQELPHERFTAVGLNIQIFFIHNQLISFLT